MPFLASKHVSERLIYRDFTSFGAQKHDSISLRNSSLRGYSLRSSETFLA